MYNVIEPEGDVGMFLRKEVACSSDLSKIHKPIRFARNCFLIAMNYIVAYNV